MTLFIIVYRKIQHQMSVIHDHNIIDEENKDMESSTYTVPEKYMVVRGSMKSKLPPALIINSCNLRVLDPIGQGSKLLPSQDTLLQF